MKKIFILILPLILLGACSTNPVLPKKDDIKISREAPTDACQDLGSIEGRTTKMNGKTEDALEDMKEEAIKKGANYGWPVITYGINYDGKIISEITEKEGMEQPLHYWLPSIAPCGMTFVTGDRYPDWKGHLLVGSLKFKYLELLKIKDDKVISRQKIAQDIGRLRNVIQGSDGYIYIAVEQKGIFRITPN